MSLISCVGLTGGQLNNSFRQMILTKKVFMFCYNNFCILKNHSEEMTVLRLQINLKLLVTYSTQTFHDKISYVVYVCVISVSFTMIIHGKLGDGNCKQKNFKIQKWYSSTRPSDRVLVAILTNSIPRIFFAITSSCSISIFITFSLRSECFFSSEIKTK